MPDLTAISKALLSKGRCYHIKENQRCPLLLLQAHLRKLMEWPPPRVREAQKTCNWQESELFEQHWNQP